MAAFLDLNGAKVLLDNIRKEFQSATAPDSAEILAQFQEILDSEGWQLDANAFTFGKLYKNISPYIKVAGINSAPNIDKHSVTIPATAIDSTPISISATGYEFNFETDCTVQIDCSNSNIRTSGGKTSISANGNNLYYFGGYDSISNFNLASDTIGVESFLTTFSDTSDGTNTTLTFSTGADSSCLVLQNITGGTVQILIDKYPEAYQIGEGLISDLQINSDSDVGITALDSGKSKLINLADNVNISGSNISFVDNRGDNISIATSNSNDSIFNSGSGVTINSKAGNDFIFSSGDNISINAGIGRDSISIASGENISILGGRENDSIFLTPNNSGHVLQFRAADNNDSVWGYSDNDSIFISELGDSSVSSSVLPVANFKISLSSGSICLMAPENNSWGGTRLNVFNADCDNSLIPVGAEVSQNGEIHYEIPKSIVFTNVAESIQIDSSFNGYQVFTYNGNDSITISKSAKNIYLDAGSGNDYISIQGGSELSIRAGYGNDTIQSDFDATDGRLFLFDDYFQGVNVIDGLNSNDSIQINADYLGSLVTIKSANFDSEGYFVLTLSDSGRTQIKLKEAFNDGGKTSFRKMGQISCRDSAVESFKILIGSDPSQVQTFDIPFIVSFTDTERHELNSDFSRSTILGDSKNNFFVVNGANSVSIVSDSGNDFIDVQSGTNITIDTGAGNDSISVTNGENLVINAGGGNDFINLANGGHLINYAQYEGNDTISGWADNNTLNVTGFTSFKTSMIGSSGTTFALVFGSNTITFADAVPGDIVRLSGDVGEQIITIPKLIEGTNGADTLNNEQNGYEIKAKNGKDVITNTGNYVTIDAGLGKDTVTSSGDYVSINGGYGDDVISLGSNVADNTISGGGGNDTIFSNGIGNKIEYNSGDGNDTIYGFSANDTIFLSGVSVETETKLIDGSEKIVAKVSYGEYGLILKLTDGSTLTLKGKKIDGRADNNAQDFKFLSDKDNFKIVANIDGSEVEVPVFIENKQFVTPYEVLENADDKAFIEGTAIKDTVRNSGDNVKISVGSSADSIYNDGSNVSIDAGTGNDKIYLGVSSVQSSDTGVWLTGSEVLGKATAVTVLGGKGQDSIWSNSNGDSNPDLAHTFQYNEGDGNDVIFNFGVNDRISLDGSTFSAVLSDTTKLVASLVQKVDADNNLIFSYDDIETTEPTRTFATFPKSDGFNYFYLTSGGDISNESDWTTDSSLSGVAQIFYYLDNDGFSINTTDTSVTLNNFPVMVNDFVAVDNPDRKDVIFYIGEGSITLKDIELGRIIFIDGVGSSSTSTTFTVTDS